MTRALLLVLALLAVACGGMSEHTELGDAGGGAGGAPDEPERHPPQNAWNEPAKPCPPTTRPRLGICRGGCCF